VADLIRNSRGQFIKGHYIPDEWGFSRWNIDEEQFLIKNYEKMKYSEISNHLGKTISSIRYKAKLLGLKKGNPSYKKEKRLSEKKLKNLYIEERLSINDIARKQKVSGSTIKYWLNKYDIKVRTLSEEKMGKPHPLKFSKENLKKRWDKRKIKNLKDLEQLYCKKDLNIDDIAKIFNVAPSTVWYTLKKERIPIKEKNFKGKNNPFYGKHHSDEIMNKIIKHLHLKPNKTEMKLLKIIKKNKFPFRYCGDGQIFVNGRIPDFINYNGKKKVIELFGRYWHDPNVNQNISERSTYAKTMKHYKKYGFDCLIIWEEELINEKEILQKIERFSGGDDG